MAASKFNPETFAAMTFQGKGSVESFPVPVGDYEATIDSYKVDSWESQKNDSGGLKLVVMWNVPGHAFIPQGEFEGRSVLEYTGREKNLVKQELFLDLTEDGGLDMGKGMNVQLNRTREAIDLNDDSEPWSFDMFVARRGLCSISHRPDAKIAGRVYAEVKAVAHL